MKRIKLIKVFYMVDMSTAQKVMQHYPPLWDMDTIFQKTYKRYLIQKLESAKKDVIVPTKSNPVQQRRNNVKLY